MKVNFKCGCELHFKEDSDKIIPIYESNSFCSKYHMFLFYELFPRSHYSQIDVFESSTNDMLIAFNNFLREQLVNQVLTSDENISLDEFFIHTVVKFETEEREKKKLIYSLDMYPYLGLYILPFRYRFEFWIEKFSNYIPELKDLASSIFLILPSNPNYDDDLFNTMLRFTKMIYETEAEQIAKAVKMKKF